MNAADLHIAHAQWYTDDAQILLELDGVIILLRRLNTDS